MICPSCGAGNVSGQKFCGECGDRSQPVARRAGRRTRQARGSAASAEPALVLHQHRPPPRRARRRRPPSAGSCPSSSPTSSASHGLSEGRDAEDTRELLTRYFDTARTMIERYGGTVEKFIGDAVMARLGRPDRHGRTTPSGPCAPHSISSTPWLPSRATAA